MKGFDVNRLVRESVRKLQPYSSARDEYVSDGSEMIFLDANENPFDNGVNRYPDPYQRSLKSVLSEQKGLAEQQILLGNGSDEVLDLIYRAFCEPNQDNIITLPPTYGMYKVLAGINAVENREVLLTKDFEPNVTEILKVADSNSKLLFICSPNNPTGNAFQKKEIKELLESFNGLVVVDEAYIDFSNDESWVSELKQYPNLIVTQTLSKAYGLAGIRLGICYASEEIIGILNKIKPPYNVNQLTQQRALQRVLHQDLVKQEVKQILDEREELTKALKDLEFVAALYPTDANFVLAKVDDANKRYQQLLEKQVVVRNRSTQPLCENTLRFTVGTPEENKKLIAILKELN
ncbi:MAG: histidinol-phosphate transaminase [Muricauda sp.]|nr:histidinol-phosphate transaminase [Allomuricauda sp.]MBO6532706.1 histidinol-phosphate transaminase [Allomuricauda sp.]MBO6590167.1 histidinol-phosphate transaminase [Allomuricauda sp.]MBO6619685.1 histidinol-phosphate transaminase [Allomuricauda sp.]MBO6645688.1 histidinol-phosphate transaminase [Allomuricauda sp.]MBO6748023.1 histidinol-phosphate transaminase [Allomuricauda sp.]